MRSDLCSQHGQRCRCGLLRRSLRMRLLRRSLRMRLLHRRRCCRRCRHRPVLELALCARARAVQEVAAQRRTRDVILRMRVAALCTARARLAAPPAVAHARRRLLIALRCRGSGRALGRSACTEGATRADVALLKHSRL
jgi:hypothetical protein